MKYIYRYIIMSLYVFHYLNYIVTNVIIDEQIIKTQIYIVYNIIHITILVILINFDVFCVYKIKTLIFLSSVVYRNQFVVYVYFFLIDYLKKYYYSNNR